MTDFGIPENQQIKIKASGNSINIWTLPESYQVEEHEGDSHTNCSWYPWNNPQMPKKEIGGTEDQRENQDYPDNRTVRISLNI